LTDFVKHSLATVANQLFVFALTAAATLFTARALGPHGKGQYTLAVLIPMLAVVFGRMGIGHAVNFFSPRTRRGRLIINTIMLSTGLSLLTTALVLPAALLLEKILFKDIGRGLIFLSILGIPLNMLCGHMTGLLQSLYPITCRNRIASVQAAANLGLLFLLVAEMRLGVHGAVAASMISVALAIVLAWVRLFRDFVPGDSHPDLCLMRNLLRFGFKSHIGNVLKDLSYRGDILILSCFLPTSSIGFYAAAVNLAEMIWKIPDAIGMVLLPIVAKMDAATARKSIPPVSRMVLIAVSVLCAGILAINQQMVALLFGTDYLPSCSALRILLPGILSFSVWKILANTMVGLGYPAEYSITTTVALAVMVSLDLLFIPFLGIDGAALASTISYLCATLLMMFYYARITKTRISALIIPTRSDISIPRRLLASWTSRHSLKN
jgi:O-antigen/teichoic acid export membrane protein